MANKGNITELEHDPHPSNEGNYDRNQRPGGANPPKNDIYPNDAIHDGQQRPMSDDTKPGKPAP